MQNLASLRSPEAEDWMNKTFPGDAVSQFQKHGRPRGEFQSREVRPLSGMVGEAIYNDPAASFIFGGVGDALDTSSTGEEVSAGQLGWAGLDVLGVVPGGGTAMGAAAKLGGLAAKEVGTFIGATILPIMKTDAVRVAALELWDKIVRSTGDSKLATAKTGVHRDWQGIGKYQISDADSHISPQYIEMAKNWTPGSNLSTSYQLQNVYKHSDLYQIQPELGIQNTVVLSNKAAAGSDTHLAYAGYSSKFDDSGRFTGGEIRINPQGVEEYARLTGQSFEEAFLEMVNHETNHAVQAINYLPSGANEAWFDKAKTELPDFLDKLKKKHKTWKALSKKEQLSPEGLKMGKEITDLYAHTQYIQSIKKIDSGWLYQQSTGEADAFWSAAMRKNPNVAYILPDYLDPHGGRMLIQQYGPKAEGANANKKQFRLYKPEHASYFEPNRKANGGDYLIRNVLFDPKTVNPNYYDAPPSANSHTMQKSLEEQVDRVQVLQPTPDKPEPTSAFNSLFRTPTTAEAAVQRLEEGGKFGPKGGPTSLVDLPSKVYRAVEEGTENFAVNVPRELGRHVGADRKIAENVENIGKGNNKTMKIVEYDKPKNSINVEDPVQIWWPHVSVKQLLASKDNLSAQAKNTLVEIRDNWFKSLEDLNKKYDTQKFSVDEYGDMKDDLSGEFSKKIARVLQDEGYDSVKYMNNAPDEFKGATDRTNYILLNKKD